MSVPERKAVDVDVVDGAALPVPAGFDVNAAAAALTEPTDSGFEIIEDEAPADAPQVGVPEREVPADAPELLRAASAAQPAPAIAHRVVVHTQDGLVRRAVLHDSDLGGPEIRLGGGDASPPETIPSGDVKAIFFMLGADDPPAAAAGPRLTVTFPDGRQLTGTSPDHDPGAAAFFLVPADGRTRAARVWIRRAATRSVTVA